MTVSQAQAAKIEMEREILAALHKFEKACELSITGVSFTNAPVMSDSFASVISVTTTVEL